MNDLYLGCPIEDLSIEIPEDLPQLSTKAEPDLDDLDQLLQESVALSRKPTNRRIYKETKQNVDDMLEDYKLIAWEVLEHIQVWAMTRCKCGGLGVITFCRYMRKTRQVGQKTIHWETIEELPAGEKGRMTLVTREVQACEHCVGLEYEKFESFQEVVG